MTPEIGRYYANRGYGATEWLVWGVRFKGDEPLGVEFRVPLAVWFKQMDGYGKSGARMRAEPSADVFAHSRGIAAAICFGMFANSLWLGFAVYFTLASLDAMLHTVKRSYLRMAEQLATKYEVEEQSA